jgi:fibronectin-binding autotransporter adhesin
LSKIRVPIAVGASFSSLSQGIFINNASSAVVNIMSFLSRWPSKAILFLAFLVVFIGRASAQQTVTYTDGENDSSNIVITSATNPTTLTISSGSATQSGAISDSGTSGIIDYAGTGTLTLSNANTYSGLTTVSSGTLVLSGDNTTSGGVTVNGGTLDINAAGTSSTNSALGTGELTVTSGTIDNTSGGAITVLTNNAFVFGAVFTFGGSNNLNLGTGILTNTNRITTITLGGSGSTLTFGGLLENNYGGDQTLTVNGTGNTLVLGSYRGDGEVSTSNTINGSGNITISGSAINGRALTYSGTGTLTLGGATTFHVAGGLTLQSGTLILSGTIGSSVETNVSTIAIFNETSSGAIVGNSSLGVAGGTTTLDGTNTYTAGTFINNATLILGSTGSLSSSDDLAFGSSNNGTFQLGDSNGAANASLTNLVADSSSADGDKIVGGNSTSTSVLTINNSGADTFNGILGGSNTTQDNLALVKSGLGTLTLGGANTYSGGTSISGGTLLANNTSGSATGSGAVTVNSGGALGGNGTINTSGASSGNAVTVAAGGVLNQSIVSGGLGTSKLTLALQSNQTVNLLKGAQLAFDLGATGVNDQVVLTGGTLTLNSQSFSDFIFTTLSGFTGVGTYELIMTDASGDISGSLNSSDMSGNIDGYMGTLSVYNSQDLLLTVAPTPELST